MIKKFLFALAICVSIIIGLSSINIHISSSSRSIANAISKSEAVNLTIVDTQRRYTNITWRFVKVNTPNKVIEVLECLNYWQQVNAKIQASDGQNRWDCVYYPVITSTQTIITNTSKNNISNIKKIKFRFFHKIMNKLNFF